LLKGGNLIFSLEGCCVLTDVWSCDASSWRTYLLGWLYWMQDGIA